MFPTRWFDDQFTCGAVNEQQRLIGDGADTWCANDGGDAKRSSDDRRMGGRPANLGDDGQAACHIKASSIHRCKINGHQDVRVSRIC